MADVIVIKGAVRFPITVDPSVWIFDDRKIDLATYQGEDQREAADPLDALKGAGAQWDKELREGIDFQAERRSLLEHRKALEGDYAMPLAPFLDNAEPLPEASLLRIHREGGEAVTLPLADARRAILQFAKDGKPIRDRGPVLLYLPEDWREGRTPVDAITVFEVC